jgi:hypothetical protein
MNGMLTFGLEITASLTLSALVLSRLQSRLQRIGENACDRQGGTDFRIAYTQLMMIIAPLLVIAYFSRAGSVVELSTVQQVKSSLWLLLCGQFAGLVLVGRAVWKAIPRESAARPSSATDLGSTS